MQPLKYVVVLLLLGCATGQRDLGLVLSGFSHVESRGCFNFNQSISLCFHVHPSSMKLVTKEGEILAASKQLARELSLFQISDVRFLGYKSLMIPIPEEAPTTRRELLDYWYHNYGPRYTPSIDDRQLLRLNYQEALGKLRAAPEILLIELASASLARQRHQVPALGSFHVLCKTLLSSLSVDLPTEFQVVERAYGREKRCTDLRGDPNGDKCLGMCGPRCRCWHWVCGDCCEHGGCRQHDLCCRSNFFSTYCLTPWKHGLGCASFGGYPKCLR